MHAQVDGQMVDGCVDSDDRCNSLVVINKKGAQGRPARQVCHLCSSARKLQSHSPGRFPQTGAGRTEQVPSEMLTCQSHVGRGQWPEWAWPLRALGALTLKLLNKGTLSRLPERLALLLQGRAPPRLPTQGGTAMRTRTQRAAVRLTLHGPAPPWHGNPGRWLCF